MENERLSVNHWSIFYNKTSGYLHYASQSYSFGVDLLKLVRADLPKTCYQQALHIITLGWKKIHILQSGLNCTLRNIWKWQLYSLGTLKRWETGDMPTNSLTYWLIFIQFPDQQSRKIGGCEVSLLGIIKPNLLTSNYLPLVLYEATQSSTLYKSI